MPISSSAQSGYSILTALSYGGDGVSTSSTYYWSFVFNTVVDWCNPYTQATGAAGIYGGGTVTVTKSSINGYNNGTTSSSFTAPLSGNIDVSINHHCWQGPNNSYYAYAGIYLTGATTVLPRQRYAIRIGDATYGPYNQQGVVSVTGLVPGGNYTIQPVVSCYTTATTIYVGDISLVVRG